MQSWKFFPILAAALWKTLYISNLAVELDGSLTALTKMSLDPCPTFLFRLKSCSLPLDWLTHWNRAVLWVKMSQVHVRVLEIFYVFQHSVMKLQPLKQVISEVEGTDLVCKEVFGKHSTQRANPGFPTVTCTESCKLDSYNHKGELIGDDSCGL